MEIGEEMIVTPQDAKGLKGKLFDGVTIKKNGKSTRKRRSYRNFSTERWECESENRLEKRLIK